MTGSTQAAPMPVTLTGLCCTEVHLHSMRKALADELDLPSEIPNISMFDVLDRCASRREEVSLTEYMSVLHGMLDELVEKHDQIAILAHSGAGVTVSPYANAAMKLYINPVSRWPHAPPAKALIPQTKLAWQNKAQYGKRFMIFPKEIYHLFGDDFPPFESMPAKLLYQILLKRVSIRVGEEDMLLQTSRDGVCGNMSAFSYEWAEVRRCVTQFELDHMLGGEPAEFEKFVLCLAHLIRHPR